MAGTQRGRFSAWLQHRLGARTQGQLAQKIGVSSSTVSRWMTGQATPGPRNIVLMAEYLEVAPEEIRAVLPDPLLEAARTAREAAATDGAPSAADIARELIAQGLGDQVASALRAGWPQSLGHRAPGARRRPDETDPAAG